MKKNINKIYILSFIFTFHISLLAYVNSTYLTQIIPESYVGIVYTIAALATLAMLSKSSNILTNIGNRRFIVTMLLINSIALAGIIASFNAFVVGICFVILMATNTLVLFSIDIFIEHYGTDRTIGKTRGLYLTIQNIAWIMSPLITSILVTRGGYSLIYTVAFFLGIVTLLGILASVKKFGDSYYTKTPFQETYARLRQNRNILAISIINFVLQFFFVWMVIYTPIYLYTHARFSWEQIGVIFTIMLIPFVLFSLPIGILIDKYKVRVKYMLYTGFIITIISTVTISYIDTTSIAIWACILFCTRFGASIIETTSEIYFFANTREQDAYLLSVFRDMNSVALVIAPIIATLLFMYIPFKQLYAVLGAIVCAGMYYIPRLTEKHA